MQMFISALSTCNFENSYRVLLVLYVNCFCFLCSFLVFTETFADPCLRRTSSCSHSCYVLVSEGEGRTPLSLTQNTQ